MGHLGANGAIFSVLFWLAFGDGGRAHGDGRCEIDCVDVDNVYQMREEIQPRRGLLGLNDSGPDQEILMGLEIEDWRTDQLTMEMEWTAIELRAGVV